MNYQTNHEVHRAYKLFMNLKITLIAITSVIGYADQ